MDNSELWDGFPLNPHLIVSQPITWSFPGVRIGSVHEQDHMKNVLPYVRSAPFAKNSFRLR